MRLATWMLLLAMTARGQEALRVNRPVEGDLAAVASQSYTIRLNTGEYAAGSVDQRGGPVAVELFLPDGSRLRGFPGPPAGKREFAFIAETDGAYRLELKSLDKAQAPKYELP